MARTTEFGRTRLAGPCSACGDGDTAMRYHSHDDDEKSYTLAEIEQLAREWSAEPTTSDTVSRVEEDLSVGLTLSLFLAWLKRREKEEGGR